MSVSDPLAALLDGLRVPDMPTSLADRIAAQAARPDRVRALPASLPPRRRLRRWTRRGVWTTLVAVNLIVASAVAAAIGGGVLDPHRIVAAAHRIVEHIRHPHAERRVAHHSLVVARGAEVAAVRPMSPPPTFAAPVPTMSRGFVTPPVRADVAHGPIPRLAAAPPARRLPSAMRERPQPFRHDRADGTAHRAEHPDRLRNGNGGRRAFAEQRQYPIDAASGRFDAGAGRADPTAARTEPQRTDAPPVGFGPRWRQRGWRGLQNWRNVATDMPTERQPAELGDRQVRRGEAFGPRQQQRRGDGFRPGRRFGGGGGGPRRGGGGGRRRF